MEAAQTFAQATHTDRSQHSERKCLVTGEVLPKDELIRFVVGPDHLVVADLAQNLPGRGMWTKPDRATIETALTKGLFSKAAKEKVGAPPDLVAQIAKLMHKRCLDFLGLAKRAGIAVLGQPQVESALKAHKLEVLFLASDATQSFDSRLTLPTYTLFTRDELGAAFGHEQIVYAGLTADALTQKLKAELTRLSKVASIISSGPGNGYIHQ